MRSAESLGLPFLAAPQQPDEIGRLGPYRVLRVLGQGGMGMVLQGHDPDLDRPVALKVMLPRIAANADARQRFLREGRAAAALRNDHIVQIFQVSEERGVPFLALEFLEGMPLDQFLAKGRTLTVPQILRIGREVAKGLQTAHDKGLIHRDVKPANLWLDRQSGRVKILDFGLARAQTEDVQLTQSGAVVGTPAYMAPEQARGEKLDGRCDLFSLGVVLYRLCTGKLPFQGGTTIHVLMALATQHPPPPQEVKPTIPAGLSELVMQLLEKEAANRPASAREVITRLQQVEREVASATTGTAPERLSPEAVGSPAGEPSQAVASAKPYRSVRARRWLFAGVALLVLVPPLVWLASLPRGGRVSDASRAENGTPLTRAQPPDGAAAPPLAEPRREDPRGRLPNGPRLDSGPGSAPVPEPGGGAPRGPLRKELTIHLGNGVKMTFVRLEPGTFWMGAADGEADALPNEKPQHEVEITQPFYLGKYEVTQEQYQQLMGVNPSYFASGQGMAYWVDTKQFPVESVTWHDAQVFCKKLTEREGEGYEFRLPTEAEWEYACREGASPRQETSPYYPFGKVLSKDDANFTDKPGRPTAVGSYRPNALGLYDMHGNVWEWCADWYGGDTYRDSDKRDPKGPAIRVSSRILRGGSWGHLAWVCRAAFRNYHAPADRYRYLGFRVAAVPSAQCPNP